MPVKVRCTGCEKVLNVPDRARGKAIRCPQCQTVLKVPAGKSQAAKRRPSEKPQPAKTAAEDDRFLAGMDLRRAEDTRVRVCVKCGTEAPEPEDEKDEIIDCPNCGHNIDTGVMSDYMRKKRARRGPDPEEFWGTAWSGSLKFVGQNVKLVMRTGMYWSIFISLAIFSIFCAGLCTNIPPMMFWFAASGFFFTGALGWFWFSSVKVIQHTMGPRRRRKMEYFHFDFFANIALGIKAFVWPRVLFMPVVIVTGLCLLIPMIVASVFGLSDLAITVLTVVDLTLVFIAYLIFPLAMIHMSMPYTYKAWIPYDMAIVLGKNILPALYWFVMLLATLVPVGLTMLLFNMMWEGGIGQLYVDVFAGTVDLIIYLLKLMSAADDKTVYAKITWWAIPIFFALVYIFILIAVAPLCILYAFPAVFLMRANGYIGLYFHDKMDLVKEQKPNELCGFWPRYLALLVDWLVLTALLAAIWAIILGIGAFFIWLELDYLMQLMIGAGVLLTIIVPWMYFAKPESMTVWRGSIGKRSLGLAVTDEDGDTLTFQQATGRYFGKVLAGLILGGGYVMAAFHEKKQALHDTMAGTIVVWQGDDERNEI